MIPGNVDLVYSGSLIAAMQLFSRVVASAGVTALAGETTVKVASKENTIVKRVFLVLATLK
jgi:hypothetical protein